MQGPEQGLHVVVGAVGFASLVLVWLGLVLGILLRDGRISDHVRPATLAAAHQTALACGLTLALVHGLAQLAAPGGTRLLDLFVPFLHGSHPVGVGLGTVGLLLTIALAVSAPLRGWLGHHRWRVGHRLGYVAFALLVLHAVSVGPDLRSWWLRGPVLFVAAATIGVGVATAEWTARIPELAVARLGADGTAARWLRGLRAGGWRGLRYGLRRRGRRVTVHVDATRCARFGFCQHEAPDLFELRDDGRLRHVPTVSSSRVDAAILAARACPTRAIVLSRQAVRIVVADPPTGGAPPGADAPGDAETPGGAWSGAETPGGASPGAGASGDAAPGAEGVDDAPPAGAGQVVDVDPVTGAVRVTGAGPSEPAHAGTGTGRWTRRVRRARHGREEADDAPVV